MTWKTSKTIIYEFTNKYNPREHMRITEYHPETKYRKAICKLVNKLGNILTGGRKFNWIGMSLYETSSRGQYFYTKIKDILLFGRSFNGKLKCNTDNKRYRF